MHWLSLFAASIANAIANIAFKRAVTRTPFDQGSILFSRLTADPWMWIGVGSSMLLLVTYLYALKGINLTIAYPTVTGLAMVLMSVAGYLYLGESLSPRKLIAMVLIISGIVILRDA